MLHDLDCAIIAGGRSTRLEGPDKALVPIDGVPMLRLIVDRLSSVARNMVVNCRAEQRASFAAALDGYDIQFALDDSPDTGPVAGLATVLERTADPTFVLGCDYPLVEPRLARVLRRYLAHVDSTITGVVPRVDGHPQPLYAVYRPEPTHEAAKGAGTGSSLRDVLDRLSVEYLSNPTRGTEIRSETFHDVDTWADHERAEQLIDRSVDSVAKRPD